MLTASACERQQPGQQAAAPGSRAARARSRHRARPAGARPGAGRQGCGDGVVGDVHRSSPLRRRPGPAEQALRPDQQHHGHQGEHRRLVAISGANSAVMLTDDADQQAGDHRAQQRAHAADHRDDEGLGQHQRSPISGIDAAASARPARRRSAASAVPMPNTSSQTRADIDAQHAHDLRVAGAGPDDQAEAASSPGTATAASSTSRDDADHEEPVDREDSRRRDRPRRQEPPAWRRDSRRCRRRCAPPRPARSPGRRSAAADSRCRGRYSGRIRNALDRRMPSSPTSERHREQRRTRSCRSSDQQ